jgi:Ca2+-dependent lipid-binding protein
LWRCIRFLSQYLILFQIENADDSATQTPFLGEIKFSLLYDAFRNILRVTLMAAFNLARPEADDSKHLNPYVTLTLQPEYHHLLQSKVQQKTRAPIFNEKFEFEVMFSNLYSQTLWFTVFNFSSDSRHTVIGQAVLPLEDLQPSVEQIFSLDLKPTTEVRGE